MKQLFQSLLLGAVLLTAAACDRPDDIAPGGSPASGSASKASPLDCHALVIGISDYSRTGWPQLGTARADAEAIGDVLEQKYGFDVVRLTDRQATRQNVLRVLDSFMDFGPDDALLIYFAGHGFYDEKMDEGYWIPYGAARSKMDLPAKEEWLWNSSVSRVISASPARHILLIADTCYGGSLFRGEEDPTKSAHWYRRAMAVPSRYLITSGNLEPVLDSGIRHSVFAQEILNYLQFTDQNVFSASDLGVAIRKKVSKLTGQLVRMGPLTTQAHAGGEFVFVRQDGGASPEMLADLNEPPVFRSEGSLPAAVTNSRLQQLVLQMQNNSGPQTDSSFVRPRILACLGPTGRNPEEETIVRSKLRESLSALGGCILVEREAFDDILREVELGKSGLVDTRVAMQIGKLLPASLILFGEIISFGEETEIHLRVVDTETSRVLASVSQPFDTAKSLTAACRKLADDIMTTVSRARPLLFPAELTEENILRADWGRFHGARQGEIFEIIKRENTGTVAPKETVLGTARLISVGEEASTLRADWNAPPSANPPAEVWLRARLL